MLGIACVIDALAALAAGDASEEVFAAIGDDWDIEERTRAQLDRLGLTDLALDRQLGSLSGGEVVTLGLAAQLLKRPDVLLLDEPTNNLDVDARHELYAALDDFAGCLLLVSHDRVLLDRMDHIAELYRGEMLFYGGNFTAYDRSRRGGPTGRRKQPAQRRAATQTARSGRCSRPANERTGATGTAARNLKNAGLPKIIAGKMKRDAQESAGRADDVHAKRVDDARARLDDAERALRDEQAIVLDLPDTSRARRTHGDHRRGFAVDSRWPAPVQGCRPDRPRPRTHRAHRTEWGRQIDAVAPHLRRSAAGRREASSGPTAGSPTCRSGWTCSTTTAPSPRAWPRSRRACPHTRRMHLLAQFLFRGDRIHLPVGALSGGERLRATLACVLYTEPAPQLLLLDEPTNNLDLVSVGQLESALNAYEGAFVVVSHDERFLDEIGVQRRLRLSEGHLETT